MLKCKDKIAIITGSAGGLGKEFANRLLQKGWSVCLSDINQALGEKSKQEFLDEFGIEKILFVPCDVRKHKEVQNLFLETRKYFETDNIDLLVNNAGVADSDKLDWKTVTEINFMGVMIGTTIAMEEMSTQGGTVINVASILGLFCAGRPNGRYYIE